MAFPSSASRILTDPSQNAENAKASKLKNWVGQEKRYPLAEFNSSNNYLATVQLTPLWPNRQQKIRVKTMGFDPTNHKIENFDFLPPHGGLIYLDASNLNGPCQMLVAAVVAVATLRSLSFVAGFLQKWLSGESWANQPRHIPQGGSHWSCVLVQSQLYSTTISHYMTITSNSWIIIIYLSYFFLDSTCNLPSPPKKNNDPEPPAYSDHKRSLFTGGSMASRSALRGGELVGWKCGTANNSDVALKMKPVLHELL